MSSRDSSDELVERLMDEGARQRRNAETIRKATLAAARATGLPGAPPKAKRGNPERDKQIEVVRWLRACGVLLNAAENERRADSDDPHRQARFQEARRRSGITSGWPDLTLALDRGGILFVEMKAPRGSLSPAQRELHEDLKARGHRVIVARDLPEIHAALADFGTHIPLPPGYRPLPGYERRP